MMTTPTRTARRESNTTDTAVGMELLVAVVSLPVLSCSEISVFVGVIAVVVPDLFCVSSVVTVVLVGGVAAVLRRGDDVTIVMSGGSVVEMGQGMKVLSLRKVTSAMWTHSAPSAERNSRPRALLLQFKHVMQTFTSESQEEWT